MLLSKKAKVAVMRITGVQDCFVSDPPLIAALSVPFECVSNFQSFVFYISPDDGLSFREISRQEIFFCDEDFNLVESMNEHMRKSWMVPGVPSLSRKTEGESLESLLFRLELVSRVRYALTAFYVQEKIKRIKVFEIRFGGSEEKSSDISGYEYYQHGGYLR